MNVRFNKGNNKANGLSTHSKRLDGPWDVHPCSILDIHIVFTHTNLSCLVPGVMKFLKYLFIARKQCIPNPQDSSLHQDYSQIIVSQHNIHDKRLHTGPKRHKQLSV